MWDIFPIKLSLCISNPKSYVPTFFILNLLISNQINGPNKLSSCMPTHKEYDHSLSSHLLKSIKVFSLPLLGSRIGLAKKKELASLQLDRVKEFLVSRDGGQTGDNFRVLVRR